MKAAVAVVLFGCAFTLAQTPKPKAPVEKKIPELNQKIVEFATKNLGEKVGSGQCSALAEVPLKEYGGKPFFSYKADPTLAKDDYIWGTLLGPKDTVLPGDIIQFRDAKFVRKEGNRTMTYTYPHHTAIVGTVNNQGTIEMLHQNYGGKQIVQKGYIHPNELKEGKIWIYRPQPKS